MQNTITKPKRNRIPTDIKIGIKKLQNGFQKVYYNDLNYNVLNRVNYRTI